MCLTGSAFRHPYRHAYSGPLLLTELLAEPLLSRLSDFKSKPLRSQKKLSSIRRRKRIMRNKMKSRSFIVPALPCQRGRIAAYENIVFLVAPIPKNEITHLCRFTLSLTDLLL